MRVVKVQNWDNGTPGHNCDEKEFQIQLSKDESLVEDCFKHSIGTFPSIAMEFFKAPGNETQD